jgi:hypothetical protein
MKYFTNLDYPKFPKLLSDLERLLQEEKLFWKDNQISINTLPNNLDDYHLGTGSLDRNWADGITIENSLLQTVTFVPKKVNYQEHDFTCLCNVFKGTEFETMYNFLNSKYKLGRVRIMKIDPKKCMSWHHDYNKRVHYALLTSPGAHLVVEDEVKFIELNSWYLVDTTKKHTAFNSSTQSRIHIVAVIYD